MTITYPFTINLPDDLTTFYMNRSRDTGRKVADLIVSDLQEYHEARRFAANVKECGHR